MDLRRSIEVVVRKRTPWADRGVAKASGLKGLFESASPELL